MKALISNKKILEFNLAKHGEFGIGRNVTQTKLLYEFSYPY